MTILNPTCISDITMFHMRPLLKTMGCSNCGWNLATCDYHHIIPRSKNGTDDWWNITYLCPNCHRLAHEEILKAFVSIEQQVENVWKDYFEDRRSEILKNYENTHLNLSKHNAVRKDLRAHKAAEIVRKLREAGIDYTKFGWVKQAAMIINISPQKVRKWLYEFAPDLIEGAFERMHN